MPLSYPPLKAVEIDGEKRWTATCRTCGQTVVERPQLVKAAVDEQRRAHGFEADCLRRVPCPVIGCTAGISHHHHTTAGVVLVDWCNCEEQS